MEDRLETQNERVRIALVTSSPPSIGRPLALACVASLTCGAERTSPTIHLYHGIASASTGRSHSLRSSLKQGRHGFDAVVGEPAVLGGKRISAANGVAYREHLVVAIRQIA